MKKLFHIMFLLSFVCGLSIAQDAVDRAEIQTGPTVVPIITIGEPQYDSPDASLYDNGPLVTHPGGMPNGYDLSSLQSVSLPGMNILGYGAQILSGLSVADDFTVPAGGWQIDQIQFFTYQSGSTLTSTINDVRVQIWNGPPNGGGSIVYGNLTTNRLATTNGTGFSSIYRSAETVPLGTTRPIMVVKANINTTLAAGTYWVQWQMGGTLASGPWVPPVTILGSKQKPGSNALQFNGTAWTPLLDDTTFAQDLPFVITGGGTGTWTTSTTTVGRVFGMVINPGNPNIMYVAQGVAPGGVNKTTDGGLTWFAVNNGLTNPIIQAIAMSRDNPQVLYAGTNPGANEGVYKTTNGGVSWTNVSTGIAEPAGTIGIQAIAVHPTNPLIAWCTVFSGAADAVNGIYKTTDGGANWSVSNTGIGAIKNFLSLAMSPADPNTIYTGSSFAVATSTGPSVIYKSTDGGANWVLSSTGLPTDPTEINAVRALEVSEFNPNVVIAGLFMNTVNGGFYVSTDAGANWTKKHNGLPTATGTLIRSLTIRPGTDNEFYVGLDRGTLTDIGVRRTTDGGNNWTSFNSGTMLETYAVRALKFKAGTNPTLYGGVGSVVGQGVYENTLSGAPTVPVFSVSPSSKDFGGIYIGSSSANQTFIISNIGVGTLTITAGGISIVGTNANQFVLTDANTYPINLLGGQSATVDVKFSPTSAGAKTANLQIVHNAGSPGLVPLTGVGVTPPAIPYSTDFESFAAGQVACQDPVNWTTWSQLPCSAEDAYISTLYAKSGTKSFVIVMGTDFVKPLVNQTTGTWTTKFWVYMPTGKGGYFNILTSFPAPFQWGVEIYFDVGGAGRLLNGVTPNPTFTWTENTWHECKVIIDLDADQAQFFFNGTQVGANWGWSRAGTLQKRIAAVDFYGPLQTVADEAYFDDFSFQSAATTFQLTVNVANGWNMVSIPGLHPVDQLVNTWWAFRDMSANVFRYLGGYLPVTVATPGLGYWMKHAGARTYNTGDEWPAGGIQIVPHTPLAGAAGWNLIGGYELSVATANITTVPPGLQTGPVYKYSGGYLVATTLDPGYGYWIKLIGAGQIIIPEVLAKGTEPVEYFPDNWGKIILTDATGVNYTLYAVKGKTDLNQYELPPAPMAGMFDIRFSSGRIAEDINSAIKTIEMSGVTYPLTVRVEGMDIRLMDETGKTVNVNLKAGEDVVISDASVMKLMVSGELIPAEYALEQNYPNPFNPSTVIEFSLPEDVGNVKLSIYNTLGEKVAELVNTALTAGKYQYQWNVPQSGIATGMYIYELRTDKFVSVKKMMLMK